MSDMLSPLDQLHIEQAEAMAGRVAPWVEAQGFRQLIDGMPSLHAAGFIAVDNFLNDKGLAELQKERDTGAAIYNLKELFHRLEVFGYDPSYAAGDASGWMYDKLTHLHYEGSHEPHFDDNGTHTFFLHLGVPSDEYSYIIQPEGHETVQIPIREKQLVVMDGNHTKTDKNLPRSVVHHVDKPIIRRDNRSRVMYVHEQGYFLGKK